MSENDFQIVKNPGVRIEFDVDDRTTSGFSATIKGGEAVGKYAASYASVASTNFVLPLPNNAPELGSDVWVGIAAEESDETSSADGKVLVDLVVPSFTVIRGKATTSTNVDTASALVGLMMDAVCVDRSGAQTTQAATTIDENEGDDPNVHGLIIVGGDIDKYTLDVIPNAMCTISAPYV